MSLVREVRARAQRRTGNLYDTYFTRKVSAYLTAALIPVGISPNTVTTVNIGVLLACCALIAFGEGPWVIAGACLVHLYAVLDSVDGELARWFKKGSLRGMFLEDWSAYTMIAAFPIAVGMHLARTGWGQGPVALAVAYAALARNAMPVARRVILGVMQESPELARREAAGAGDSGEPGRLQRLRLFVENSLLYATNVWVCLSLALMAEGVVGGPSAWVVVILFAVFYGGLILKEVGVLFIILRRSWLAGQIGRAYGAGAASGNDPCRAPSSDDHANGIVAPSEGSVG